MQLGTELEATLLNTCILHLIWRLNVKGKLVSKDVQVYSTTEI